MSQLEFYLARAAEARADADAATLVNVRDRCLRAEAAWSSMAVRAGRSERERQKVAQDKAEALATVNPTSFRVVDESNPI